MSFFKKSGIVNVKMVITEEKILSNIDKIQKLINPNSKKQIVQLEEDSYFKDLVESVKTYLIEYPKKKNFPQGIYKASYDLVEYATNQFEENTKKIEELIRQREKNIKLASVLRDATTAVKARAKNWKEIVKKLETKYPQDVVEALTIIGKNKDKEAEEYTAAIKLIDAKINNLESNFHIEIDMERIEDRSKALSFIGIEIAEALKYIPAPIENDTKTDETNVLDAEIEDAGSETTNSILDTDMGAEFDIPMDDSLDLPVEEATGAEGADVMEASINTEENVPETVEELENFIEETRIETKPSLWQRFKNSKFVRTLKLITQIRITIDCPALPSGKEE